MLNVSRESILSVPDLPVRDEPDEHRMPRPGTIIAALRRRKKASLAVVIGCVALGEFFALTTTPLFTATSEILIDGRRSHVNDGNSSNRSLAELGMDPASIESQLAVVSSERNAIDTIKALRLEKDSEFTTPTTILASAAQALRWILGRAESSQLTEGVPTAVLEGFMKRLEVKRVQQSYVLALSFSAATPERAATIANTLTNQYVNAQVSGVIEAREASARWLRLRLASIRSDIAVAEQGLRFARDDVERAGTQSSTERAKGPSLEGKDRVRDLGRLLDDKRTLYAALVDRSGAMLQLQSLPIGDASVLKSARPPDRKSHPNTLLITILSLVAGLAAACGLAVWQEMTDGTFRTPSQLRDELGLRLLASMPRAVNAYQTGQAASSADSTSTRMGSLVPVLANLPHTVPRVVGVTSSIEGENSAFVARALASDASASGLRILFVAATAPLSVTKPMSIYHDEALGVDTISIDKPAMKRVPAVIGFRELEAIEAAAGQAYDLVVLDLPPMCAMKDSSGAGCIDGLVLVVAWGSTERAIVAEALHAAPAMTSRLLGAVFTGADAQALRRYSRAPVDRFYDECAQHANG